MASSSIARSVTDYDKPEIQMVTSGSCKSGDGCGTKMVLLRPPCAKFTPSTSVRISVPGTTTMSNLLSTSSCASAVGTLIGAIDSESKYRGRGLHDPSQKVQAKCFKHSTLSLFCALRTVWGAIGIVSMGCNGERAEARRGCRGR